MVYNADMRRIITLIAVLAVSLAASAGGAYAQTSTTGFSDVPDDHPRKADIDYAVERGWLQGDDDGTFQPDRIVDQAGITAVASRVFDAVSEEGVSRLDVALFMQHGNQALTAPLPASVTAPVFSDWPPAEGHEGHEDADASVGYAAARGWFRGYPDGTFRPRRTVTSRQVAAVIGRAFPQGISRAELAAFLLHGNRAVIAHEASRAWDKVGEQALDAQAGWNNVCDDVDSLLQDFPTYLQRIMKAHESEIAAEDAVAVGWQADIAFWETIADPNAAEEKALSTARAAAAAWSAAADAERAVLASWRGDLTTEEGRKIASDAAWAARRAETAAWNSAEEAVQAAAEAESRAEATVADAWSEASDKATVAAATWNSFPPLTNLVAACGDWKGAWEQWEEWASAMSVANDALAAVA